MYHLRKCYLNCVTPSAEVIIVYWVSVATGVGRLPLPGVSIASFLLSVPGERPAERAARRQAEPVTRGNQCVVEFPGLDLHGRWVGRTQGPPIELLSGRGGSVRWHPRQLAGEAEVRVGDRTFVGSGYSEVLETTIRPARLPFERLRWGRFVGANRASSWVEWADGWGKPAHRWLAVDGVRAEPLDIADDRVILPGAELGIERERVIHDRVIGASLRGFGRLAPLVISKRLRAAREAKWLGRGTLRESAGPVMDQGWVINERVDFGALARTSE